MNDGGPAFPQQEYVKNIKQHEWLHGMSLRDWFAGMALASMTVAPDYSKGPCNSAMAERAYVIADHMIVRRQVDNYQAAEEPVETKG